MSMQALSIVLNVNHFPFVIEVACWAAKREFLKLEKWINDKIKEHHVREKVILAVNSMEFSWRCEG